MNLFLAIAALLVSVAAVAYARVSSKDAKRSADAADRSAKAAESADRQTRTPRIAVWLDNPAPAPVDRVIYHVRNDGPQSLDSMAVYRPRPPDKITYEIAVTGGGGFSSDEIELGPLDLTQEARFTLGCGAGADLPEFWVRIVCRAGADRWEFSQLLPSPRGAAGPIPDAEVRSALEMIREYFQEIISVGGHHQSYFLDNSRKGIGQRVSDLDDRVSDWPLKERLSEVAKCWSEAFAHSPPESSARVFSVSAPWPDEYRREDEAIDRRKSLEAEKATQGLEACSAAIARLNELERRG